MSKIGININEETASHVTKGLKRIAEGLASVGRAVETFAAYDPEAALLEHLRAFVEASETEQSGSQNVFEGLDHDAKVRHLARKVNHIFEGAALNKAGAAEVAAYALNTMKTDCRIIVEIVLQSSTPFASDERN
ncbi:MAG: hypothetical protein AB7E51_08440 [Pseudodesulfovibrio sp.]|uniref:hypothetical protein n=1 Tax=Pseudodesulfovibrio sp. TaxID=2035812 RepID=UPI003D0A115D